jgi:hypothetical protein
MPRVDSKSVRQVELHVIRDAARVRFGRLLPSDLPKQGGTKRATAGKLNSAEGRVL